MLKERIFGRISFVLSVLLILLSCQQKTNKSSADLPAEQPISPANGLDTSAQSELLKFWVDYDFGDELRITDPNDSEQKLVDFIASFPNDKIENVNKAIHTLLSRAEVSRPVFDFFTTQLTRYLYDPNSPMRSDQYYEPVLHYLIASKSTSDTDKQRYQMQLDMVRKNQPGFPINDFSYQTTSNKQVRFSETKGVWRLLVFYDPTCTHCSAVISQLKSSATLNELISQRKMHVLAIDPLSDRNTWEEYQYNIPQNWENGLDSAKNISKNQLFNLRAYPTIYLVNTLGIVVLKDCDVEALEYYLLQL